MNHAELSELSGHEASKVEAVERKLHKVALCSYYTLYALHRHSRVSTEQRRRGAHCGICFGLVACGRLVVDTLWSVEYTAVTATRMAVQLRIAELRLEPSPMDHSFTVLELLVMIRELGACLRLPAQAGPGLQGRGRLCDKL